MPLNQKGVAHFLLLLAAVGVIAYVVIAGYAPFKDNLFSILNRKQDSQAAQILPKVGTFEPTLNQYGDAWVWKKPKSSSGLPISGGGPGFSEYVKVAGSYPDPDNSILEQYTKYLSKSNAEFLYVDSFEPSNEGRTPRAKDLLYKLHQKDPKVKILGYFVMHEPTDESAWESYPESWFVHKKGTDPADPANRVHRRPELLQKQPPEPTPLMDITNEAYRTYAIQTTVNDMRASGTNGLAGFNGIMSDLMYIDGLRRMKVTSSNPDPRFPTNIVPAQIEADWTRYMIQFTQDLKTAMGPNLYLFGNVEDDDTSFMESDLLRDGRLDGVIFEDPFNHIDTTGPVALQKVGGLMNKMKDRYPDKRAIFMVTGEQSGKVTDAQGRDVPHSEAEERRRQMYFLTAYLTMWNGNKNHSLEYYHPRFLPQADGTFFRLHFNSSAFFREWDLDLGAPVGSQDLGGGLYLREYTNGKVYWNSTTNDLQIPANGVQIPEGGLVSVTDGQALAAGRTVKGKSGDIYVSWATFDQWSQVPPPDTLSGSAACATRPNLRKNTLMTRAGLEVTLTAETSSSVNPNVVYDLNFTGLDNANVIIPSVNEAIFSSFPSAFAYKVNRSPFKFLVKQKSAGAAATVNLTYSDRCGSGTAFFGGGTAASWPGNTTTRDLAMRPDTNALTTSTSCNNNAPRVHLEWWAVPGATAYNIYRNSAKIGTTASLAYNDDSAAQATAYTYQIEAVVGSTLVKGATKSITSATGCIQLTSPDFGSNTAAKCNGLKARNYLEWLPVQGASVYKVYRSTAQPGSGVKLADLTTNVFNDDSVTPGVTYIYQIEAVAGSVSKLGNGKSLTALTTCMPKPDLNANTGSYCLVSSVTGTRVHLEWTPVSGAGYKIYRSTNAPGSGIKLGETSGPAWNDDTAVQGTTYNYQIEAFTGSTSSLGTGKTVTAASPCYTPIPKSPTSTRPYKHTPGDYNGDGRADVSVFRPQSSQWHIWNVATVTYPAAGDIIVAGDWDGNRQTDQAFYRPSTGQWFINGSYYYWGTTGDIPVPGDYNGDGYSELAVYRPANGYWYINGVTQAQWGISTDIPVPGDYNGDGKTDIAVFRPQNGYWYVYGISQSQWGISTDIPVPGDYNGDGKTDIAVYRPQNGTWYVAGLLTLGWGAPNHDVPVPADYNGDGITDVAVWRPSNGYWYGYNVLNTQWGIATDKPISIYPTKL